MVRSLDDVPGGARMMNGQQLAAVAARGEVFVSAGAGTGKTSVLVERFVQAVCDDGLDVDSVLAITYTRKAAAELRSRIRTALVTRDRPELARELDGAWISTIHGFCARLLRAYPLAVGIDPRFRELDDEHGAVLRGEAFESALAAFCAAGDEPRLRLLATYGSRGLRRMLTGVYETLRSAGRELVLELGELPDLDGALADLRDEAAALAADPDATPRQLAAARAALDLPPVPEDLIELKPLQASGPRAAAFEQGRKLVQQAALEVLAGHDKELLQELLDLFAAEYAAGKERESALDFEDLQLYARNLLRDHSEAREREQLRFRTIMVDEFQDTNRLQCEIVDLLRGGPGAPDAFFVGDELAVVGGLDFGEFCRVGGDQVREFEKESAAGGGGELAPFAVVEGGFGGGDGAVDVVFIAARDQGPGGGGVRVGGFEPSAGGGVSPLAADEHFAFFQLGHGVSWRVGGGLDGSRRPLQIIVD